MVKKLQHISTKDWIIINVKEKKLKELENGYQKQRNRMLNAKLSALQKHMKNRTPTFMEEKAGKSSLPGQHKKIGSPGAFKDTQHHGNGHGDDSSV